MKYFSSLWLPSKLSAFLLLYTYLWQEGKLIYFHSFNYSQLWAPDHASKLPTLLWHSGISNVSYVSQMYHWWSSTHSLVLIQTPSLYEFLLKIWVLGNFIHLVLQTRRRQWHPTPVHLPGKSHGQRSLVGCSPWGHQELDTTEWLHFHFSLSCIGEGNGNPLQCSCLENPRDGGAWWAAVYGVTQSQTRLKRLSSSSSRVSAYG